MLRILNCYKNIASNKSVSACFLLIMCLFVFFSLSHVKNRQCVYVSVLYIGRFPCSWFQHTVFLLSDCQFYAETLCCIALVMFTTLILPIVYIFSIKKHNSNWPLASLMRFWIASSADIIHFTYTNFNTHTNTHLYDEARKKIQWILHYYFPFVCYCPSFLKIKFMLEKLLHISLSFALNLFHRRTSEERKHHSGKI